MYLWIAQRLWSGNQPYYLYIVRPPCSSGGARWGLSPHTSDQRKGINKLKLRLPDPRKHSWDVPPSEIGWKGTWVSSHKLSTGVSEKMTNPWYGWKGHLQPLQGQTVQILWVIIGLCRPPPCPGPLNEGGQHTGGGSPGECNDNSSARPRFGRGNKKITSQNKYYLSYSLKKGKLMPRHHA